MLLKYFKSNHISIVFLTPLIVVLLWSDVLSLHDANFAPFSHEMPAYKLLMSWISNKVASSIIALLLITFEAFYMVYVNRVYNFISRRTYLTSIFFILISSAFFNLHYLHPAIIANIFVLMTIVEVFSTYKKNKVYGSAFNAGFYVAVASLFYINAVILLFFVFISLAVIRSFNWREYLSVILGFACAYIIAAIILFYFDAWNGFVLTLDNIFHLKSNKYNWPISYYVFTSTLIVLGFVSVLRLSTTYTNNKVSTRNYFLLFIWLLILLFLTFIFIPFVSIELIVIIAIPLSYLLTNYYLSKGRVWLQEISFIILILSFSLFYI